MRIYLLSCARMQILDHPIIIWSYGVTVSTLDSEFSDRGSNPRRTFFMYARVRRTTKMTRTGLEPAISGSGGRRLIH